MVAGAGAGWPHCIPWSRKQWILRLLRLPHCSVCRTPACELLLVTLINLTQALPQGVPRGLPPGSRLVLLLSLNHHVIAVLPSLLTHLQHES